MSHAPIKCCHCEKPFRTRGHIVGVMSRYQYHAKQNYTAQYEGNALVTNSQDKVCCTTNNALVIHSSQPYNRIHFQFFKAKNYVQNMYKK